MNVKLPEEIETLEASGNFKLAIKKIRKILNKELPLLLRKRLEYEIERIDRLKNDYKIGKDKAFKLLKNEITKITKKKFNEWIENGYIEHRVIDGKEKYFNRFISNLFKTCDEAKKLRIKKDKKDEEAEALLNAHIDEIINSKGNIPPLTRRIKMEISLNPNAVPDGEIVMCWMPFPRIGEQQIDAKLISTSPEKYILAPKDALQRTIFFEQKVEKNKPTIFRVEYEYTIKASYIEIDPDKVKHYDKDELYIKYTKEQPPHIVFTEYLKNLCKEIVGEEKNPYYNAWKIYDWITHNVKYSLTREYSTYENISEYVATNFKGDCGFQAILFITLCRITGIPARWQSGWYINKIKQSPHDWAQFYINPYGWLFADPSFGGGRRVNNQKLHKFYFGNIDNFRLVFNNDITTEFYPKKEYIRSDWVDNQRGEIEWKGGNIYYNKFKYKLKFIL